MPRYLFREGVKISPENKDIIITTPYATRSRPKQQTLRIKDAEAPLKKLLEDLLHTGVESNQHLIEREDIKSAAIHLALGLQLKTLFKRGLLICEIDGCNGTAIRLLPIKPGPKQRACPKEGKTFKLSNFASIQPCLDGLDITTPSSPTTLRLQDHRLYQIIPKLVEPCTTESIRELLPEDLRLQTLDIISTFLTSETIGICNTQHIATIDAEAIAAGWSKEDLTFHCHTRRQSIDLHQEESLAKEFSTNTPKARHQRIILNTVKLKQPLPHQHNSNFFQVIEKRKTIRTYNNQPINSEALGHLLWHSMHTREEICCDPGLPRSYEGLLRPVASAGGLHSIELYLCIKQCIGIPPGFYHYDSFEHALGKLSDLNQACENMLTLAVNTTCRAPQAPSVSAGEAQQPDLLIVMASRYQRNASLHSGTGLAYALILKDAGSIYQQLYLVATALGLAPCGLSFGSSELFEQASGISSKTECSVGEFMIGNPKQGAITPQSQSLH